MRSRGRENRLSFYDQREKEDDFVAKIQMEGEDVFFLFLFFLISKPQPLHSNELNLTV